MPDGADRGSSNPSSISKAAIRGSAWSVGGYATSQGLRFAGNLVLTRLLFPEIFGLMSLLTSLLVGLAMFSDVGIGPAIVQRAEGDDPRFLRTAWTVQVLRGVLLWIAACVLAKPLALFYGEPRLAWAIPLIGLSPLLLGFEATSTYALQRRLRWERLTMVEVGSAGLGIAATVAFAAAHRAAYGPNHPGALWAVIAGGLVGSSCRVLLSHLALPGIRHRFLLDREHARSLFAFGRWIFVSTLLTFLVGQSDRLLFGKLVPFDVLGVYGIAAALAMLPAEAVQRLGSMVLFPTLSRMSGQDDFAGAFARARLPLVVGGAGIASGLIAAGPLIVALLYDPRYAAAGWMLQVLAISAWFQILESTNSAATLATGRVNVLAANRAAKLASMIVFLPAGFHLAGFPGALVGLAASDVVKYGASLWGLRQRRLRTLALDAGFTLCVAAVASAGSLAAGAFAARQSSKVMAFLAVAAVVGTLWGTGLGWAWRRRSQANEAKAAPA